MGSSNGDPRYNGLGQCLTDLEAVVPCPVCETSFTGPACSLCEPGIVARFEAMQPGSYPALAMPPAHGVNVSFAAELRRALLKDDLAAADATWMLVLRGLRGVSPSEREVHAGCWDAYGHFLEHAGREDEARRAHQRAVTARKDPSEMKRKLDGVAEARLGSSAASLRRLHSDEYHQADPEAVKRVQAELDRQLASQARNMKIVKVGALSFAGLAGGVLMGLPAAVTGAVGAGLGLAWVRLRT
jgi:hypothetical protein